MSENIELVERRLSPKLMMFVTDNFLRSLCDLSGKETFTWFPELLLFGWRFGDSEDGDEGDCSNGNDNDDLFMICSMTMPSSCSWSSSAIVAGWLWLDTKRVSFSSLPFDCGDVGGDTGWIEIGGGDGVAELIDSWVASTGSIELVGDSGGSDIQIDACWTLILCRSWFDFYLGKWTLVSYYCLILSVFHSNHL